ncbi:hypothetical protein C4573_02530 [Candidatus Woesearchaeota archaeon]|nr:MAG: hypothetical protein C4573_02530 [Candidatus Woesearchaeota archaeon]
MGDDQKNSKDLLTAITELNTSINKMIKIFEDANQEMIEDYQNTRLQIKDKLDEVSDQNEKIAEGIVSLADMLKKPEEHLDEIHEQYPVDTTKLQEVSFNNRTGIMPQQELPEPQQYDFNSDDPFAGDPFAQQNAPDNFSQPTQQNYPPASQSYSDPFAQPRQSAKNTPDPFSQPKPSQQQYAQDPFAQQDPYAQKDPFAQQDFSDGQFMPPRRQDPFAEQDPFAKGNLDMPPLPDAPQAPEKRGLFSKLMKK